MASKPKIAVVDILLSYPPRGGAGVDLFNNFRLLVHKFEIKIFGVRFPSAQGKTPNDFERGVMEGKPPVECFLRDLDASDRRDEITGKILKDVSDWNPDLVFIADGWTLKPYLTRRISEKFKTIVRLYAYEMLCPRNNQKWLFDHKCENNALDDCAKCLACASAYADIVRKNRNGLDNPLTFEASLADIWRGDYHSVLLETVRNSHFIVYNSKTADILRGHGCRLVTKTPGAVDVNEFAPRPSKTGGEKTFHIVVCGRMDDRAKGTSVAIEAGQILKAKNIAFKMTVTSQKRHDHEWLFETGWQSKEQIIELLSTADCALVPSLWEEAFGMAWVEAMSMGVPVIASRIGGPAEYIQDGVTGLLAEAGSAEDLAAKILTLYNDRQLGKKLSENGRNAVEKHFTWSITSESMGKLFDEIIS